MTQSIIPTAHDIEPFVAHFYHSQHVVNPESISLLTWNELADIRVLYRPGANKVQRIGDIFVILVEKGLSLPDRRAVIAHEIGHVLLHTGDQLWLPGAWRAQQEEQARRFAVASLMPWFMVCPLLECVEDCTGTFVEDLAEKFGVPYWMAVDRLRTR